MMFNFKNTILSFLTITCCYPLHAQRTRRICDLKPIINSPTDTAIADEPIDFKLSIGNKGPDKLITGDGIIVVIYTVQDGQNKVIYSNILAGQGNDSIPLQDFVTWESAGLRFASQNPTQIDLCVQIFSEALVNGDSAICAYYDPDKSNDIACNRLTILPKGTTVIRNADGVGIQFLVYPNPTRDKLYIQSKNSKGLSNTQMVIRDITGRIIQQETYTPAQMGIGPIAVNVERFPVGWYTICLQTGKDISTKKFAIKR